MSKTQHCNDAGLQIIIDDEKFCADPYQDGGGIWTIGYGHTQGVDKNCPPITRDTGKRLLQGDVAEAERAIDSLVKYELTPNQFSALVSFVFNIGWGNFERSSALILLNQGDFDAVGPHMALWNKDHRGNVENGLITRRAKEAALFYEPDAEPAPEEDESNIAA